MKQRKVNSERACLWSGMVNSFGVIWDPFAPAMSKSALRSMVRNTILECNSVEVLCIMVPTKEAADMGDRCRLELLDENESESMKNAFNRVFFKVLETLPGTTDLATNCNTHVIEYMNHTIRETFHCLRTEIDNETFMGQVQAATRAGARNTLMAKLQAATGGDARSVK